MVSILRLAVAVALTGLLVAACSGTKVSDSWSNPEHVGKIKNVYLIGIAKNELRRMMFENTFNRRLADEGVKSTQSYPDLPKDQEAERELIIEKMQANGCDSVLLTRVVDQRTTATFTSGAGSYSYRYVPGPTFSGTQVYDRLPYYNSWISYYSSGYRVIPQSSSSMKLVVLNVESVLYDLKTEDLIWAARMETDLQSDLEEMMKKFVDQAVKDLRDKGLI